MRPHFIAIFLLCLPLPAQGPGPVYTSAPSSVPQVRDHTFNGEVKLNVDATDVDREIVRISESIPVQESGEMVLLYPQWETTSHSATASAVELAGLHITAEGHELSWWRNPFNVHAFHVDVPRGVRTLSLRFDYLPSHRKVFGPSMIVVPWCRVILYPAGWYARDISVKASLKLPQGFHAFTALRREPDSTSAEEGEKYSKNVFATSPLDILADAPVYAGRFVSDIELGNAGKAKVMLNLLADREADLHMELDFVASVRALISQTSKIFGPPPFSKYDVIVSLSDEFRPGGGQEHQEEGENNMPASFLTDYVHQLSNRDLIAHEYVHAWNGRFRQPEGLWSPNFNLPTDPSLLWVYEGQTELWGRVLAARAGMRSTQDTLEKIAIDAALMDHRAGREWKNLADSTLDALYMPSQPVAWRDWQRREDYYPEGVLLWLGVDARLRQITQGKKGLDDFAAIFFRADGSLEPTKTYTSGDVCAVLDRIAPYDWKSFLIEQLTTHDTDVVKRDLKRAGWELAYQSTPTESFRQEEAEAGITDLSYSIGLQVRENGAVRSVEWNGPSFEAGLRPGAKIIRVNDRPFTAPAVLNAVSSSVRTPVRLSVQSPDGTRTVILPYSGPLRYPILRRMPGEQDWLGLLLESR